MYNKTTRIECLAYIIHITEKRHPLFIEHKLKWIAYQMAVIVLLIVIMPININ